MSRAIKVITVLLLLFVIGGNAFAADAAPKSAVPAYLLSILLGYGSGHYYLGDNGTGFLIGDLAGTAGVVVGGVLAVSAAATVASATSYSDIEAAAATLTIGYVVVAAGSLITSVSRIWEVVDIFGKVDKAKADGRVAEITVTPVIEMTPTSFETGISISY